MKVELSEEDWRAIVAALELAADLGRLPAWRRRCEELAGRVKAALRA